VGVILPFLFSLVLVTPARADTPPYTDPAATGYVGLCDADGHAVTSGSVDGDPYVVRATGSQPPPPNYRADGQTATLYAFVPRKGAPPSEWSSESLSAPTLYSDWHFPTAIATTYDPTLGQVLADLPPQWDGYYQIRLYYSAPNRPVPGGGYAATDIRINGKTWSVVRGGPVDCTSGKATTKEALIPGLLSSPTFVPALVNGRPNPKASWRGGVVPSYTVAPVEDGPSSAAPRRAGSAGSGVAGASPRVTPSPGESSSSSSAFGPASDVSTSATSHSSTSSGAPVGLIVALAIVVMFGGGAAVFWLRQRRPSRRA
jgi:hypothetical protein